jgi:SAM-dependent methyltransferase
MTYRTEDRSYGADYWNSLDGGAGYQDSLMWADIAHAVAETILYDKEAGVDRSGEHQCLDVGCAAGYFVLNMRKRGCETWGLDYSRYALDQAPEGTRDQLHWFDLTDRAPSFFGPSRFTLLTCFETLEHIPEGSVGQALTHLRDSLVPGGVAVLTICVLGQPDPYSDPTHDTIMPRSWWERKFDDVGFERVWDHEDDLRRFWLFSQHKGVFVVRRPT